MKKILIAILMVFTIHTLFFGFFVFAGISTVANSQKLAEVKIEVNKNSYSTLEIINLVESQSKLSFSYNKNIDLKKQIKVDEPGLLNLEELLRTVTVQTQLVFMPMGKTIGIAKSEKSNNIQQDQLLVQGNVIDENGDSLPGANIKIKGTGTGSITNSNGTFAIKVNSQSDVLEISFVGYKTSEYAVINGSSPTIQLSLANSNIDEVVITALGLTRKEKSLGYSVTELQADEMTRSVSSNWLNGLDGKVAGLTFDKAGGIPGGSMRVTLRGDNSLNYGKNEALFVVDGIPIASDMTSTTSGANYATNDPPIDYGNGASDINPDDIESVSVLKGPAAAALYGSRAANGAIIITTKSASKKKGIGITVNSSVTFEQAGYFPDFQTEYGPGNEMGESSYSLWTVSADQAPDGIAKIRNQSTYAYGEKFNANDMRYLYASYNWDNGTFTKLPWVYQDDWYTGLFKTGVTYNNTVSINGSNGKGTNTRLSLTDYRNDWILPNSGYNRNTVALTLNTKLNNHADLRAKVNYNKKTSDNMPSSGYSRNNPLYTLTWGQNVNSIDQWKQEYFSGRFNSANKNGLNNLGQISLVDPRSSSSNPYRTLYENINTQDRDRIFGSLALTAHLSKNLNLDIRSGLDWSNDLRTQRKPFLTAGYANGFYREQIVRSMEVNSDFMLQYNNTWINKRFGFSTMIGGNNMTYNYYNTKITLRQLGEEGVYNTSNVPSGVNPNLSNYRKEKVVNSLYGLISISWDDMYFLDITGRNDWSSTLAKGNWSYFYPSVATSVLVDKVLNFEKNVSWIDMLKVRLSWANVGNDTDPYSLDQLYSSSSTYAGGYYLPSTIPDPNIQPENIESWELGVDGRLLGNRIHFDIALYNSSTTSQIYSAAVDQITGATKMKINTGEISNKGIEVAVGFVPVKTNDFMWTFDLTWSANKNKLLSMRNGWDPTEPLQTDMGTTIGSRTYIYSYVGEEMHKIYGRGFQRAPEGSTYIDSNGNTVNASGMHIVDTEGYPVLDDNPDREIANVNPDWRAGMTQRIRYKNLSLAATFTGQLGGHAFSVTNFALSYTGKLKNSLKGRNDGLVHKGVNAIKNEDGSITYRENTTVTSNILKYYANYMWNRNNTEMNTFSTSFLKLKEVHLDYNLSKAICSKTGFLQSANIGIFATNLFCITKFPQYDPETGMLNGSNIHRGIETMSLPMTRSYGLNIKLSF